MKATNHVFCTSHEFHFSLYRDMGLTETDVNQVSACPDSWSPTHAGTHRQSGWRTLTITLKVAQASRNMRKTCAKWSIQLPFPSRIRVNIKVGCIFSHCLHTTHFCEQGLRLCVFLRSRFNIRFYVAWKSKLEYILNVSSRIFLVVNQVFILKKKKRKYGDYAYFKISC